MAEQPESQPETTSEAAETDCEVSLATSAQPRTSLRRMGRMIWRVLVAIVGSTVVLAGLGLSIPMIPGPGFVVILAGLAILATEFAGPRRLLRWLPRRIRQWREDRAKRRAR
ncbi:MAG: PGPGW domain-containing protein [Phycisphaerae bacterium]|nr:PGPGW domain-containing protein [Phycisphaerae bacterium]